MKMRNFTLAALVASATLVAAPVLAQSPKEGGSPAGAGSSDRSSGGGGPANAGGGAGARSGGSVASDGGGSSSSSGGSGFGSTFNNAMSSDLSSGSRGMRETAPAHRAGYAASGHTAGPADGNDGQKASPRGSGSNSSGGGSGERAVPRGGSSASGSGGNNGGGNTRSRTAPSSGDSNNSAGAREVPNWSRPRGDRPATGVATERVGAPPDRNGGYRGRYYDPYYYGYDPYGYSYYGYGLGYGCYSCYAWGMGYGLYSGFGWNPYFGDPYDPYYAGTGGYSSGVYNTHDQGNLKLKVKPRNAKVYVDGYFVGLVDQFDGAFQKLALNGGRHKVEVKADGFETAEFDVLITPDQTVTFQGELKRIQ